MQALKALFKLRQLDIRHNVLTAIHSFQSLVLPILMYGSEIWGPCLASKLEAGNFYSSMDSFPVETLNLKFCKFILGVKRNSANAAVRAELGLRPLLLTILAHSCKYWLRLVNFDSSSIVYKAYLQSYSTKGGWSSLIKNVWVLTDLPQLWTNHGTLKPKKDLRSLAERLINIYDQSWLAHINKTENNKLRIYATFKNNLDMEPYLLFSTSVRQRSAFAKLRISDHKLAIETGRHKSPRTPPNERFCSTCTL